MCLVFDVMGTVTMAQCVIHLRQSYAMPIYLWPLDDSVVAVGSLSGDLSRQVHARKTLSQL